MDGYEKIRKFTSDTSSAFSAAPFFRPPFPFSPNMKLNHSSENNENKQKKMNRIEYFVETNNIF